MLWFKLDLNSIDGVHWWVLVIIQMAEDYATAEEFVDQLDDC